MTLLDEQQNEDIVECEQGFLTSKKISPLLYIFLD